MAETLSPESLLEYWRRQNNPVKDLGPPTDPAVVPPKSTTAPATTSRSVASPASPAAPTTPPSAPAPSGPGWFKGAADWLFAPHDPATGKPVTSASEFWLSPHNVPAASRFMERLKGEIYGDPGYTQVPGPSEPDPGGRMRRIPGGWRYEFDPRSGGYIPYWSPPGNEPLTPYREDPATRTFTPGSTRVITDPKTGQQRIFEWFGERPTGDPAYLSPRRKNRGIIGRTGKALENWLFGEEDEPKWGWMEIDPKTGEARHVPLPADPPETGKTGKPLIRGATPPAPGAPTPTTSGAPGTAPGSSPAAPGAPAKDTPGAPGTGTPGAPRTDAGRPDFAGMSERMKRMTPEERAKVPLATGRERDPRTGRPSPLFAGGGQGMPDFMRGILDNPNNPLSSFFNQLMRTNPGQYDPYQGGNPYTGEGMYDPAGAPGTPSVGNVLSSAGGGMAPGSAAGGGPAAGPDPATGATAAAPPVGARAVPPTMVAGDGATAGVPAGAAAGGAPPIPPGAGIPSAAAVGVPDSGIGAVAGGAANIPAAGLAGAIPAIARARDTAEANVMNAALGQNFGQEMNPRLASDRERFRIELANDPALRQRMLEVMYNEQSTHPQGVQAIAESALNRASVRKKSLRSQLGWHRWEPHGYYQAGNRGRGMHRHLTMLNQALENALGGSNISNFATDNSSGGLASRERASGRFRYRAGYSGESFFAPGWAEPKFARDWDQWMSGMQGAGTLVQA
jgi:hypothetical protein